MDEPGFDVHEPGVDRSLGMVRAPRVAEPIRHDAEPLGPADPMLDGVVRLRLPPRDPQAGGGIAEQ